jgi:hypothetical protein
MFGLFLITLVTGLAAACFYLNTSEEVPKIMAIAILAICFCFDIIVAPWQIQFLLLIAVLVSTRNVSMPSKENLG